MPTPTYSLITQNIANWCRKGVWWVARREANVTVYLYLLACSLDDIKCKELLINHTKYMFATNPIVNNWHYITIASIIFLFHPGRQRQARSVQDWQTPSCLFKLYKVFLTLCASWSQKTMTYSSLDITILTTVVFSCTKQMHSFCTFNFTANGCPLPLPLNDVFRCIRKIAPISYIGKTFNTFIANVNRGRKTTILTIFCCC